MMKEVALSEFKAKCLGILKEVRRTRKPIRITRFGKPVAEVVFNLTLITADERLIRLPEIKRFSESLRSHPLDHH